jgi:hypothetical protein
MPDFDDIAQHPPESSPAGPQNGGAAPTSTDRPFLQMFFDVARGEQPTDR